LVIGFALIIFIGAGLLSLPIATQGPQALSLLDALFTAISATTVTGLVVVNTADTFSLFGQIIILLLIQVGGVGFITISIVLFRLIGRRVSIYERNLLRQTLGVEAGEGIVQLTLSVLLITLVIETAGAVLLFTQWVQIMDWRHAAYYAVFHSVSAFCNAGFDLFRGFDDPILQFTRNNPLILVVMSVLITIGTLGITVIYDVLVWPRERHLSLHTRLILPFTLLLMVVGTIILIFDEALVERNLTAALPVDAPWLLAFFTIVSSRTAGITLIPVDSLGQASQLIIFVWMFIGGAPASMGGGVGLSTVAVVFIALWSTARGHDDVRVLERTLPTETVVKAVAVLTVSTTVIVMVTLSLALLSEGELFALAFEVVSAYSNTGYSLGITGDLGPLSLVLVALTMFWGRLGPLTLVVALAQRRRKTLIRYPEEKIIIG
jgi:trk system potassium uptake protein TrkH